MKKSRLSQHDEQHADVGGIDAADARRLPDALRTDGVKLCRRFQAKPLDRLVVNILRQSVVLKLSLTLHLFSLARKVARVFDLNFRRPLDVG